MAVFNDVLTTEGQRFLMKMLSGETQNIQFTKLVLGDGNASGDLKAITAPVHAVAEVAIDSVTLSAQNDVTITAIFRNTDITEGFYMREKAIFATDGTEEVLVLYSNAGSLAEYIEPSTSEVYEKIFRSVLLFNQSDNVNITVDNVGYTTIIDFNAHLEDFNNPHKVTKEQIGLGNVDNKTINNQTPEFMESSNLTELSSGDTISVTLGKIAKALKDFISHIGLVASSSILGHIKIGTGLTMSSGTASVKLSDSLTLDDSYTAATSKAVSMLNANLAYQSIDDKITINATNAVSASGYTENGNIVIRISVKAGLKGILLIGKINDINFCPRSEITGIPHIGNSDLDEGKILAPALGETGNMTVWIKNELLTHETIMFTYPKRLLT